MCRTQPSNVKENPVKQKGIVSGQPASPGGGSVIVSSPSIKSQWLDDDELYWTSLQLEQAAASREDVSTDVRFVCCLY